MAETLDPGLALFAGLNVIPKRATLTEYSCRVDPRRSPAMMERWQAAVRGIGVDLGDVTQDHAHQCRTQLRQTRRFRQACCTADEERHAVGALDREIFQRIEVISGRAAVTEQSILDITSTPQTEVSSQRRDCPALRWPIPRRRRRDRRTVRDPVTP